MTKKPGTIHIQWVRSGIGCSRRQKGMVRSLGLGRLHQVVQLPDTPVVRGLAARIPHLVRIVKPAPAPAWASVPEYVVTEPVTQTVKSPAGSHLNEGRDGVLRTPETMPENASGDSPD